MAIISYVNGAGVTMQALYPKSLAYSLFAKIQRRAGVTGISYQAIKSV